MLGEVERDADRIREAIAAQRAVLKELTREKTPMAWAEGQNSLGEALLNLGVTVSERRFVEEAITAYHAALEVYATANASGEVEVTKAKLWRAMVTLKTLRN